MTNSVLATAWSKAASFVKEPYGNRLAGKTALSCAFGLACETAFIIATGEIHLLHFLAPSAGGMALGLGLVKCGATLLTPHRR